MVRLDGRLAYCRFFSLRYSLHYRGGGRSARGCSRPFASIEADHPCSIQGTNFSLAMADSAGGTGGLVSGCKCPSRTSRPDRSTDNGVLFADTVIPGPTNNCTIRSASSYSPITLDFPASNACDEIDMTIDGGQAPYTVSVLVGYVVLPLFLVSSRGRLTFASHAFRMTGLYSNTTSNTTSVRLQNSILQGETFNGE